MTCVDSVYVKLVARDMTLAAIAEPRKLKIT